LTFLSSLSSILQAQIAEDCDRYDEGVEQEDPDYLLYPIFDIPFPSLPPHCGGNIQSYEVIGDGLETMLSHETTDEELKNKIDAQRAPPLMSIFRSPLSLLLSLLLRPYSRPPPPPSPPPDSLFIFIPLQSIPPNATSWLLFTSIASQQ
jgi:hypothetical protein